MSGAWAVIPAAGSGSRFGGERPKQYVEIAGKPLIEHTLDRLLAHPAIDGAMVALAAADAFWRPRALHAGKPVLTCVGGADRAASVRAALDALALHTRDDVLVLVHDAARPNLEASDLDALMHALSGSADGALLGAPVRDTLKRIDAQGCSAGTEPREGLWRAFTPQGARLSVLRAALDAARAAGVVVTDEAMALEHAGRCPRLVEGRDDNIKVTTPADRALVESLLTRRQQDRLP